MKSFLVLAVYLTSVFAAPPDLRVPQPGNTFWDFRSSMLNDFEENLKRMRDEFDQLEKSLVSGFHFDDTDNTSVRIFSNGSNIFNIDPKTVKNESRSDTKIVDGKVVHTEEKVIANGNSVVHFKKVEITPKGGASVPPFSDKPRKPLGTPSTSPSSVVPSSTTDAGSSKNDLDSEQVDNDEKTKTVEGSLFGESETPNNNNGRPRDVEEIENIQPAELRIAPVVNEVPNELDENDDLRSGSDHPIVDLSNDTRVNDIRSQNIASGGLIEPEPEAELVDVSSNSLNRPTGTYDAPRTPVGSDNPYYYRYTVDP